MALRLVVWAAVVAGLAAAAGTAPVNAGGSVFVVDTTSDANITACTSAPGDCSLRGAINNANAMGGFDAIHFEIPGAGPHVIQPVSLLPPVTGPTLIDGYTQPGASENTQATGSDAVLQVVIDGSQIDTQFEPYGLRIDGGSSTIKGLAVQNVGEVFAFTALGVGIQIYSDNNVIEGNFIGTDVTGESAAPNVVGVGVGDILGEPSGSNNLIGGTSPAARNVVSGNTHGAIVINSGDDNLIQGNYVGTDPSGTQAVPNVDGINVAGGTGNVVGGTAAGAGNVISGNSPVNAALIMSSSEGPNYAKGNLIGTDATGTQALGNATIGVWVFLANDQIIGGAEPGAGNVIGNNGIGVFVDGDANVIQGNLIGTDVTGTVAMPNIDGVTIFSSSSDNAIGGTGPGQANLIAYNGEGVRISGGGSTGNRILGNSIHSNSGIGINLVSCNENASRVTIQDPMDADLGPNRQQNFPVIAQVTENGSTTIEGSLDSVPNTTFRIELFGNDAADGSGYGEGQTFLAFTNVTTDASGSADFVEIVPGTGHGFISATATNLTTSDTSEFSGPYGVTERVDYGDAPISYGTLCDEDGARHVYSNGPFLGQLRDAEEDGQPSAAADGDDMSGVDDEDGVEFVDELTQGVTAALKVVTSEAAVLDAWIDFNGDGDWDDAGEQVFESEALAAGENDLSVRVPVAAAVGTTYARFRLSEDGGLAPTGLAETGEVEDYRVEIAEGPGVEPVSLIWGDNDCDGDVTSVDALQGLYHVAGLEVTQAPQCPAFGSQIEVAAASPHVWGDVDCGEAVDAVDALRVLQFVAAGEFEVTGECPQVGSEAEVIF